MNYIIDSNDLLQTVFESSVEGILIVKEDGNILMANPACEHIFGYKQGELIEKKAKTLVQSKFRKKYKAFTERYTQNSTSQFMGCELHLQGLKKDGTEFPLKINLKPTKIDAENVIVLFISDITEIKEVEKKLFDSEIRSNAILKALPDLFFVQDENATILEVYASDPNLLIAPKEEIIGKNIKEVLPSEIAKKIIDKLAKVKETKQMETLQLTMGSLKGMINLDVRFVPLQNNKTLSIARDITEAITQEALLNIRNNALASADNSILITDAQKLENPIIYCNKAFEKMTGYTKNEIYGRNCNFLQDNDRAQNEIKIMRNAILNGESCNVTLRNYKKDGAMFWNEIGITPVYNETNKLTHFISVQNDVSIKIKEEELKNQTRNILELIAQDKPIKIIVTKITETVQKYLEDCMVSVFLLNKETKTLHKLAAPQLPTNFSEFIEGLAIGPKVGSCGTAAFLKKEIIVTDIENNILWEDYKKITLKNGLKSCWSFPMMSSENQVLGVFAIYSKQKRKPLDAEKDIILEMNYLASVAIEKHYNNNALKESKKQLEKYAQILEEKVQVRTQEVMATVQKLVESNLNLEDQILITEKAEKDALDSKALTSAIAQNFPKGFIAVLNTNLQLVLAEGEALTQLGLKSLFFEGMLIEDVSVFSEERKTRIKEHIKETLSGAHLSFEIEYKNKYFSVNTAPLFDENNEINYALLVYNDISQQKKVELEIQNALKKEKELNELKSRFISMASHEFRTPLSAILTSAILIGKQNGLGKELKREKYIHQIEKNVKNLVVILNDFLSLSKLEEGKTVATNEQFDLIQFFNSLVKENEANLKKSQTINIINSFETLYVNLDVKLLRHIVLNLLSNASKYSSENSSISLKISKNRNNLLIQITDQGIGIPESEQELLFNRFFRANNATNIEGTGLGLNIAKNYIELMGGTIGFTSKINIGTTFWVELPIQI